MIWTLHDWGRQPLARALLLSVALHVALVMFVQPRFDGPKSSVVMHARLVQAKQDAPTEAVAEESAPQDAVAGEAESTEADAVPLTHADKPDPISLAERSPEASVESERAALPAKPTPVEAENVQSAPTPSVPVTPEPAADLPSIPVMQDPTWYWARQVDRRPMPLHDITPVYPEQARRSGLQGSVVIEVRIDAFGKVYEVTIIEADPPGIFEASVLKAYADAMFTPAMRDGRPVRYLGRYRVRFDLE